MLFGFLHSILVVYLGLSQHVSGIGITLLASSISYYAYTMLIPFSTTPPKIVPFSTFEVPVLSSIPIIGEAFFNQTALTYLAYILVIVTFYVLYKMPIGLTIRMAGENPVANEAQGINVLLIRTGAVMAGSALDRKSTRLNSSHKPISYAVFCLKNKTPTRHRTLLISNDCRP